MSVAVYIVVMAVISFGAVYLITETYEDEMSEEIGGEEGAPQGSEAARLPPERGSSDRNQDASRAGFAGGVALRS